MAGLHSNKLPLTHRRLRGRGLPAVQPRPWQLRRDIGMLGVLWKVSRGTVHKDMAAMFPPCPRPNARVTRSDNRRHSRQLVNPCDGTQLAQFGRSLFGLVKVWNLLPSEFV